MLGLDDDDDPVASDEDEGGGPPPVLQPGPVSSILGGPEDDALEGTDADDFMRGFAGRDVMSGRAGDDFMKGDIGADDMSGGVGDDTMDGGFGADRMSGGFGDDEMTGGFQDDFLNGQRGDDMLAGEAGEDTLLGGIGADSLNGIERPDGPGAFGNIDGNAPGDSIDGGAGDDDILFGDLDTVTGGSGADLFRTGDYVESDRLATITDFDPAEDRLELSHAPLDAGEAAPEVTATEADGNTILALGGQNVVTLLGVTGFDATTVSVVEGPDPDAAGPMPPPLVASDSIVGTDEDDFLPGTEGDDVVFGEAGNDRISAGLGEDEIAGGAGLDTLVGGVGADILNGLETATAARFAAGGELSDSDFDETGDATGDRMLGFAGDDVFLLGDDDIATGGPGADGFIAGDWIETENAATITDFEPDLDVIRLASRSGEAPGLTVLGAEGEVRVVLDGETVLIVEGTEDATAVRNAIEIVGLDRAAA
ncbi:calcium-binding protein [Jannaschia ovalis]|uniref:Calcium-binding protein n=1 Tax=Jannaschia ovalis TaxID=3038773 RepID=A0ABY8LDB5_9RHOB|nr:calcium-binding protein [Jannaschia sp. GRR-S6-38]WGH79316.1 calcium-binding protein [Jannaschia sp. GRR-S6-38]